MPRFREAVLQGVGRGNNPLGTYSDYTHLLPYLPDFPLLLLLQAPLAGEGLGKKGKEREYFLGSKKHLQVIPVFEL